MDIKEEFDSSYLVQEVSLHLHDLKADLENYLQSFGDRIPVHSIEEILDSGKYSPDIRDNLLTARELSKGTLYYDKRLHRRRELQEKVLDIMDEYGLDAIIYPHQQQLVCKAGESQKQRNGVIGSVTGFPAMVVPAGFSRPNEQAPLGVPVGLEILGRPFDEGILIEIASGIEAAESMRKPPVI